MKKILTASVLALVLAGCQTDEKSSEPVEKDDKVSEQKPAEQETKKPEEEKESVTPAKEEKEEVKDEQEAKTPEKEKEESAPEEKKTEEPKQEEERPSSQDPEPKKEEEPQSETPDTKGQAESADLGKGLLVVANKKYALPIGYRPPDLTVPKVRFSYAGTLEQSYLRASAARGLEAMFNAADKDGIELFAVSGFRSGERQKTLYDGYVARDGQKAADTYSARPGHSEHQTGLAMDISARSVGNGLTQALGNTKEGKWIAANAPKYGFILRYGPGMQARTGYMYEPWHIRYVGVGPAQTITNNGQTLEEYLKVGH